VSTLRRLVTVVMVAVALTLAACSNAQAPPNGTVTGSFVARGGLTGLPRPLSGQVTAQNAAGFRFTVTVGKSGVFVLSLPAGVYRLTGRGGQWRNCQAEPPVRVKSGHDVRGVQVVCPLV